VNFDSKIWGMFVVHNQATKFLNYESRVVIEQLTMMFSCRLIELEAVEAHLEDRDRLSKGMLRAISSGVDLMRRIGEADDEDGSSGRLHAVYGLSHHLAALTPTYKSATGLGTAKLNDPHDRFGADLMRLADADGVAVLRSGHAPYVHLVGTTPDALSVRGLAAMFGNGLPAFGRSDYRVFATDALGDFVPLSEHVGKVACGLLAAPISDCGDFILWFRKEQVIDAIWAGRPPSSAELNSTKMLQARDDFAATHAPLTGAARPWLEAEVALACEFAAAVAEICSGEPAAADLPRQPAPAMAP
jgi:light-regulated signal transduction histidine kinase (bacteriophytochrome)